MEQVAISQLVDMREKIDIVLSLIEKAQKMANEINTTEINLNEFESKIHEVRNAKELTTREKQVLELVVKGYTNKKIGETLFVSIHTAKAHLCSLLHKLNSTNRQELISKAYQLGLIK